MPSSRALWRICKRPRAVPLDKEEPRISLPSTWANKLSQVDWRRSRSLTTSSEVLSTLSWVLGAVGLVTGQPTAVGSD